MKYCAKCGAELFDEAVVCVKCGCLTEGQATSVDQQSIYNQRNEIPSQPIGVPPTMQGAFAKSNGNATAIKIFLIIGTVIMALYTFCIGLAWCLPMTLSYCGKVKRGEPISTGFKVCCLLFVSLIAGILMLCDNNN